MQRSLGIHGGDIRSHVALCGVATWAGGGGGGDRRMSVYRRYTPKGKS